MSTEATEPQRYLHAEIEARWQRYWDENGTFLAKPHAGPPEALRARHVPVPLGRRPPRRPPRGLHRDRHPRALLADEGLRRPAPHGLGRLRPARRAARHPDWHSPRRHHQEEHRDLQAPAQEPRLLLRLVARDRHHRSRLRPLDAVDLPPALQEGPRLPGQGQRQLVPRPRHRARQRRGHRRQERARRSPGRARPAAPVDDADHCVCRPPARRPLHGRLAQRHPHHAARLDRPLRGRPDRLRHRRPRRHRSRCSPRAPTR